MTPPPVTFFYDRDCGFCEASANLLSSLSRANVVAATAQDTSLPTEVRSEIDTQAVAFDGEEYWYGHQAIGVTLQHNANQVLWRIAGSLLMFQPLSRPWSLAYRFVARHRGKLSTLVGKNSCDLH